MSAPWELLSSPGLLQGALLLLLLLLGLYYTFLWPFRQFPHLPQQKPHWLLGNNSHGSNAVGNMVNFYTEMKQHKFSIFWEGSNPCVFVTDLELIKKIMVEDFDHFQALGFIDQKYLEQVETPFGLADTSGEEWKVLKRLVTPAFSGPRVKKAAKALNQVGDKMVVNIQDALRKGEAVSVDTLTGQFAMTAIGSVAFGVDINCFKDEETDFMKFGNKMIVEWRFMMMDMFPNVMRWFKIKMFDPEAERFFTRLAQSIVKQRRSSTVEHNDVLQSLMAAAEEAPSLMTPSMMFHTIVQFFSDGYFVFSELFAGIIYLIAAHPEVQDELQEELDSVMAGQTEVTEELLREMPFLDQVISEGMRRLPIPNTSRFCTKAYRVPGSSFTIPKGIKVIIPTAGLHLDPALWPDPHAFQPDRFSPEQKAGHVAGSFQPFGYGPRQCLASNLMRIEGKVMICRLLRQFRLESTEELPKKFTIDKEAFMKPAGIDKITIAERH